MIDTHAHPYLCKRPVDEFVFNAQKAGISHIVAVSTTVETGLETLRLSQLYPQLFPTIGIHPCEAHHHERLHEIETLLETNPFHAIGEIGLDFYRDNAPLDVQMMVFDTQLQLAKKIGLPIIIHSRSADAEMKGYLPLHADVQKVIHCFSSDLSFVKTVDSDSVFYSFTGMITYQKNPALEEVIRYLPLEKMMIETDCPYLTPLAFKPDENQSAYVGEIAKRIAQLKNLPLQTVVSVTTQTARSFFKLP